MATNNPQTLRQDTSRSARHSRNPLSAEASPDDELIQHLRDSFSLSQVAAQRLVEEVLHYYSETPTGFVTRVHSELQRQGWSNSKIYAHIESELPSRRFASPPLTTRQIRRVIYG